MAGAAARLAPPVRPRLGRPPRALGHLGPIRPGRDAQGAEPAARAPAARVGPARRPGAPALPPRHALLRPPRRRRAAAGRRRRCDRRRSTPGSGPSGVPPLGARYGGFTTERSPRHAAASEPPAQAPRHLAPMGARGSSCACRPAAPTPRGWSITDDDPRAPRTLALVAGLALLSGAFVALTPAVTRHARRRRRGGRRRTPTTTTRPSSSRTRGTSRTPLTSRSTAPRTSRPTTSRTACSTPRSTPAAA